MLSVERKCCNIFKRVITSLCTFPQELHFCHQLSLYTRKDRNGIVNMKITVVIGNMTVLLLFEPCVGQKQGPFVT